MFYTIDYSDYEQTMYQIIGQQLLEYELEVQGFFV